MKAAIIAKTANAVRDYAIQAIKEHVVIAAEFTRPTVAENRTIGAVYYAAHWALTIEMLSNCRKAYKKTGWAGVGKQYMMSACKAWAVDHVIRRSTLAIMAVNIKAAETAEAAKSDSSDFQVDVDQIVKNAMEGVQINLQSSL